MRTNPILNELRYLLIEGGRDGVTRKGQFGVHRLRYTDISPWLRQNPDAAIDSPLDDETTALKAQVGTYAA